jgi:hypothetical protein
VTFPLPLGDADEEPVKKAVLSYNAGGEMYHGAMCELCEKLLIGKLSQVLAM